MEEYAFVEEPSIFSDFKFIVLLIVLFALGIFLFRSFDYILNINAQAVSISATLIGKDQVAHVNNNFHSISCTFIFEAENGERYSFVVHQKDYHQFVVGDHGILTYQRKKFKSFNRKNK